jgi:hypothetical protein
VFKTVLDSGELAFLIRQIDEYIQMMEFMIRKDASFGQQGTRIGQEAQNEAQCRQTGRTWAKERYQKVWLGGATLVSMMESPNLGKLHNTAIRGFSTGLGTGASLLNAKCVRDLS